MTAVPELNLNPIPPSDQYLDALLSQDVAALQLVLKRHPSDPLVKFSLASALEKAGDLPGAIALYQELAAAEPPGLVSRSARKALAALPGEPAVGDSPPRPAPGDPLSAGVGNGWGNCTGGNCPGSHPDPTLAIWPPPKGDRPQPRSITNGSATISGWGSECQNLGSGRSPTGISGPSL